MIIDNHDFVIFVFMVLFGIIGCCFGHSELDPKNPIISKQNHENKCYAVIIQYSLIIGDRVDVLFKMR